MPELPDVTVYIEALEARIAGARFERARLATPFLLRSVDPPLSAASGRRVVGLRRLGKRIVWTFEDELFFVLEGKLLLDLEDRTVELSPRQGMVVPRGVMHRTRAPSRTVVLMVEAATVVPTGD